MVFLAFAIPVAIVGVYYILDAPFGERLTTLLNWNKLWTENDRIMIWRGGLRMALDHVGFGVGPGNFINAIGSYVPEMANHSATMCSLIRWPKRAS